MCIAISKPTGVVLDEIIYTNCFNRNSDGAGFAYVSEGKLVVRRGIRTLKKFLEEIQPLEAEHDMIIHCRKVSAGDASDDNCHPFLFTSEQFPHMSYALIHNGTLQWRHDNKRSDTSYFVADALNPIVDRDPYFFDYGIYRRMLGGFIGTNNKLVVMRYNSKEDDDAIFVINSQEGIEYNGCWFSNMSFTDEESRFVYEGDRKRIRSWTPKLYVEKPPYNPPGQQYIGGYDDWQDERQLPAVVNHTNSLYPGCQAMSYETGYGFYATDPAYKGHRDLASRNAWKAKQAEAAKASEPSKAPAKVTNPADDLRYLSQKEFKRIHKECVTIMRGFYPDIDFAGMSTQKVAEWTRREMRNIQQLRDRSNKELSYLILYGDFEAPVKV